MNDIIITQRKIREFEMSLNSQLTEEEIANKLFNLCAEVNIPISVPTWNRSQKLYRARLFNSTELIELETWNRGDFWGVPTGKVSSYGRLNRPKESVFYLSNTPLQTLKEIGFYNSEGLPAVISSFQIKKDFGSAFIGGGADNNTVSDNPNDSVIQNLYTDFFRNQFSKTVGKGTEHLFLLSNAIAKNFYDLPYDISKAWTYAAIENFNSYNVAFKSEVAPEFLEFKGAIVVEGTKHRGFHIRTCFNSQYQLCLPNSNWITKEFNLKYTPYE